MILNSILIQPGSLFLSCLILIVAIAASACAPSDDYGNKGRSEQELHNKGETQQNNSNTGNSGNKSGKGITYTRIPDIDPNKNIKGVVMIVLDTMRADHLSCYGYSRETSPNLSRLAKQGFLFEYAISSAPWTLPAMAGVFCGGMPSSQTFDGRLKKSFVEPLQRAGVRTAAITEGGFVSSHFGFDRGFSLYVDGGEADQVKQEGSHVQARIPDPEGRIEDTFRQATEWLEMHKSNHANSRFFLYIHTYEPHAPYTRTRFAEGMNPGRVGETFQTETLTKLQSGALSFNADELKYLTALYDGGIHKSDYHVGELLDTLKRLDLFDKTMVMVTSDHGEELGEHYPAFAGDHGHSLFDELVRVPMIVYDPRASHGGMRIESQVRLFDVMPTVLDALNVKPSFSAMGKSLLPLMYGKETEGRLAIGGATKVGPERIFVRWLGYKTIRVVNPQPKGPPLKPAPPAIALFDLQGDPNETRDLSAQKPEIINDMMGFISRLQSAGARSKAFDLPDNLDPALRERLEALGYIR